ncbi:MAG: hypothetical protein HUU31_06160 [Anaerolineae bacterium]|nr:hypothetical protein [Anaerolineae bacterium]
MSDLWRRAAAYGIAIAFLHRLALTVWMALAWAFLSSYLPEARADFHATTDAHLPALASPAEAHLLGVWRRWDAVHYLDLTVNGYRLDQAGSTVFGVLTPLALRAASLVTVAVVPARTEVMTGTVRSSRTSSRGCHFFQTDDLDDALAGFCRLPFQNENFRMGCSSQAVSLRRIVSNMRPE